MNKKKIIIIISFIFILLLGIGIYKYYIDEDSNTSLNISEKSWIEKNKNELVDISIFSNMPILSYNGSGIIFDFLNALEDNTGLDFNKVSYTLDTNDKTDYAFVRKLEYTNNDILLLTDNYVLVTKNNIKYNDCRDIESITIGTINNDLEEINTYLQGNNIKYKTYDTFKNMLSDFANSNTEVNGIVLPKTEYLDAILKNNYNIAYNISEYKVYYVLELGNIDKLNSILNKYYKKWASENYNDSYSSQIINNYFTFANKTEQEKSKFKSKEYVYGFIDNSPYDKLVNDRLYGINSSIMKSFTDLTKTKIKYVSYNSYNDLYNAFNANEIDFYMNASSLLTYKLDIYNTLELMNNNMVILSDYSNIININSLYSISDKEVLVIKDSTIASTLNEYNIRTIDYNNINDLLKNINKNSIIAIDSYIYDIYKSDKLKNYKVDYIDDIKGYTYTFRNVQDNIDFAKLFNFYLSYNISRNVINEGVSSIANIDDKIILLPIIGKILLGVLIVLLLGYILYRFNPKTIKKRKNMLSKGDKLKYIDILTSLKNRNYLNDNIEKWDSSEIYPQTIVVIDLNNLAYINDNYGHEEGDKIIKEAANILIKNQIDNTEILRTNGNEFLVYMVSYDEKQVLSYVKKLTKDFKDLEYGFGAAIGYSIINDAIKTIDDAINEAVLDMKNNKEDATN